jgi:hypothetical protein
MNPGCFRGCSDMIKWFITAFRIKNLTKAALGTNAWPLV